MASWKFIFSSVILAIAIYPNLIQGQNKYADTVRQCINNDSNKFHKCALTFFEDIRPAMKQGIPEINVPRMDPMTINNLEFNEQGAVVNLAAKFNNVNVVGVAEYSPKAVDVDRQARTVKVKLFIPALYITGRYNIDGSVLLFPVKGDGPFTLNLTNIDGVGTIHMIPTAKGASASTMQVDFNIQTIKVELTGLTGGETIGAAINKLVNDNSQQILGDIKPQISQRLAEAMQKIVSQTFVDMPPGVFFA